MTAPEALESRTSPPPPAPFERTSRNTELGVLGAWAASRLTAFVVSLVWLRDSTGWVDLGVYSGWSRAVASGRTPPFRLDEYPPLARTFLLPFGLASSEVTFTALFVVAMAVADLCVLRVVMATAHRSGSWAGAWTWATAPSLLGPVLWTRFDLLPALLAVTAFTRSTGGRRGSWLAAGAAVKLWPVILLPALLRDHRRARVAKAFTLALPVLVAVPWLLVRGDPAGSVTWGLDRGIQVESTAGSALALLDTLVGGFDVVFRYGAWEVDGPRADVCVRLLPYVAAVVVAAALVLLRRHGAAVARVHGEDAASTLGGLLLLLAVLTTSKVLSPQYVVWVLALTCTALCQARLRAVRTTVATVVLLAGLTHLVYPLTYVSLLELGSPGVPVLVVRNVALLVLAWLVVASFLRPGTASAADSSVSPLVPEQRT